MNKPKNIKDQTREQIFQALGEASMCWDTVPTGVFDSNRATRIGERLVAFIEANYIPKAEGKDS